MVAKPVFLTNRWTDRWMSSQTDIQQRGQADVLQELHNL